MNNESNMFIRYNMEEIKIYRDRDNEKLFSKELLRSRLLVIKDILKYFNFFKDQKAHSILLRGSLSKGYTSISSDIDLVVILSPESDVKEKEYYANYVPFPDVTVGFINQKTVDNQFKFFINRKKPNTRLLNIYNAFVHGKLIWGGNEWFKLTRAKLKNMDLTLEAKSFFKKAKLNMNRANYLIDKKMDILAYSYIKKAVEYAVIGYFAKKGRRVYRTTSIVDPLLFKRACEGDLYWFYDDYLSLEKSKTPRELLTKLLDISIKLGNKMNYYITDAWKEEIMKIDLLVKPMIGKEGFQKIINKIDRRMEIKSEKKK